MLDVTHSEGGDISLVGRFDASQTDRVKAILDDIDSDIRLDLSGMDYISSAGLGVLIGTHSRLESGGRKLTLLHPTRHALTIFKLSRLDQVLHIVESATD